MIGSKTYKNRKKFSGKNCNNIKIEMITCETYKN